MGLFPKLGIWNPVKMAENLSIIIIRVAVQDSGQLNKIWEERMERTKEWLLIADYCVMLSAIVDRMVVTTVLPGPRQILIANLLERIKKAFYQTHVGESDVRKVFFDDFFENRMKLYLPFSFSMKRPNCNDNDLIMGASKFLVDNYLTELPENSKTFFVERTERYIFNSVTLTLKTKPFLELTSIH